MSGSGREIPRASTAVIDYDAAATAPERDRALDAPQVSAILFPSVPFHISFWVFQPERTFSCMLYLR